MNILIISLVALSFFVTACSFFQRDIPKNILIGEISSLTGTESSFGQSSHNGIKMALEEKNADGGIHGKKIKIITLDNQSSREKVQIDIKRLIQKHNVLSVLGEVASERSQTAAAIAQKYETPMLSPASTNPTVTEVGNFIFRACYIDPFQGYAMARFAKEHLKLTRVAVFRNDRSNYSSGLAEYFIDTFFRIGGDIVSEETYSSSDENFENQLRRIQGNNPEAIFVPGYYNQVSQIIKQAREMGIRALFLGGDGWDSPELYSQGGKAVVGGYFSNHFTPHNPLAPPYNFIENYENKYGELPDGTAAVGYDAAQVLFAAIERALPKYEKYLKKQSLISKFRGRILNQNHEKFRDLIRTELSETKNHPGVTGSITIDENRNAIKPIVILRVAPETNQYVTTVFPEY